MNRARLVLAVAVAITSATTAPAAVVCKRKNGQVFIREACKKKETAVNLADFGAVGPQGPAGPFVETLPSGQTLRGAYSTTGMKVVGAAQNFTSSAVTFAFPLAAAPTGHFVAKLSTPPAECPGNVATPDAAPGHLCIYEGGQVANTAPNIVDPATQGEVGARPWGFLLSVSPSATAADFGYGTWGSWAVTAP